MHLNVSHAHYLSPHAVRRDADLGLLRCLPNLTSLTLTFSLRPPHLAQLASLKGLRALDLSGDSAGVPDRCGGGGVPVFRAGVGLLLGARSSHCMDSKFCWGLGWLSGSLKCEEWGAVVFDWGCGEQREVWGWWCVRTARRSVARPLAHGFDHHDQHVAAV